MSLKPNIHCRLNKIYLTELINKGAKRNCRTNYNSSGRNRIFLFIIFIINNKIKYKCKLLLG